jgi:hypothetical protein
MSNWLNAGFLNHTTALIAGLLLFGSVTNSANARIIRVGPMHSIHTIFEASLLVASGDTVEVDAGSYVGDVATWRQSNLTLRAVGGRVRLIANGASEGGKGIWVVRGENFTVDGFDFIGAKVKDRNGAGIRFEKGSLTVRNCSFTNNENGILTGNDSTLSLTIENSEFGFNGHGDGFSHNLYVGEIARLSVAGSYFHHAKRGHLLKTRAAFNQITANRLTDEDGGTASYELEFPNGGVAYVVGNIIQQSRTTENQLLISFGAEGYRYPKNELYLVNNTMVNPLSTGGSFLRVRAGAQRVLVINNLLVGDGAASLLDGAHLNGNYAIQFDAFRDMSDTDLNLLDLSQLMGKGIEPGVIDGVSLRQETEYSHPTSTMPVYSKALIPGAFQNPSYRPRRNSGQR